MVNKNEHIPLTAVQQEANEFWEQLLNYFSLEGCDLFDSVNYHKKEDIRSKSVVANVVGCTCCYMLCCDASRVRVKFLIEQGGPGRKGIRQRAELYAMLSSHKQKIDSQLGADSGADVEWEAPDKVYTDKGTVRQRGVIVVTKSYARSDRSNWSEMNEWLLKNVLDMKHAIESSL